jgi:photosystem II stability/assembly factor-like uncharacterized protein
VAWAIAGLLTFALPGVAAFADEDAWVDLSDALRERGARMGRGGLEVDARTGIVHVLGRGVYRSDDGCETWRRIDGNAVVGAYWFCHAIQVDPADPNRLAAFMKDPPEATVRSALTLDGGRTWRDIARVTTDRKLTSYGWSWGLTDWTQPSPTFMIARMHHSQRMWTSRDGGKRWAELDLQTQYMGVYDANHLVAAHPRRGKMYRSADGGRSWQESTSLGGAMTVTALLPVRRGKRMYWVTAKGLAVSEDLGATWRPAGQPVEDLWWGPVFGKTGREMLVMSRDAVYRSDDAGATWRRVCDHPAHAQAKARAEAAAKRRGKGDGRVRWDWFVGETDWGWDTRRNRLYMSRPGKLLFLDLSK